MSVVDSVSVVELKGVEMVMERGMEVFDAKLCVSDDLMRRLVSSSQDMITCSVKFLASKYGFNADEALEMLCLNNVKVERKSKVIKEKSKKEVAVKKVKSAFPLPYNGELKEECCMALRQNSGLYTQCDGLRKEGRDYCVKCEKQMEKKGLELPEFGTIKERNAVGIYEFVDPKGKKPVAYTKIMKKYKISEEDVLNEASKMNMEINREHFIYVEERKRGRPSKGDKKEAKEKGPKGRPKKTKTVLEIEGDGDDLFASLVAEANECDNGDILEDTLSVNSKKGKTEEEKEAEKAEKEAKKQAEKEEKEAKKKAEQAEKEAKKQAEKEEKEAKKQAEKAEKEAKKLAEKAEKEAKKQAEKAEKAEKEAKKKSDKEEKKEEEEDEEPDVVKKIVFEDKKYLKSKKTGIIYDYERYVKEGDQVIVGKWNEELNKIDFNETEEEDEEEEEEVEEEDGENEEN